MGKKIDLIQYKFKIKTWIKMHVGSPYKEDIINAIDSIEIDISSTCRSAGLQSWSYFIGICCAKAQKVLKDNGVKNQLIIDKIIDIIKRCKL